MASHDIIIALKSPRHPPDRTTSTTDSPALFSLSPPPDNWDDHAEWRVDLSLTCVDGGDFCAFNAADLPCELQYGEQYRALAGDYCRDTGQLHECVRCATPSNTSLTLRFNRDVLSQPSSINTAPPRPSLPSAHAPPQSSLLFEQPSPLATGGCVMASRTRSSLECGATASTIKWAPSLKPITYASHRRDDGGAWLAHGPL